MELDKANMVISGGRGIAEKEDFELLTALAKALSKTHGKVLVGCSRPVVDKGWMSSDRQVGLTGSIIAPDTYVAVGISGAIQHLVGMIRSKKIIAINTDPGCNMFKVADYGVVGDYKEILPTLIKKLEEYHERTEIIVCAKQIPDPEAPFSNVTRQRGEEGGHRGRPRCHQPL